VTHDTTRNQNSSLHVLFDSWQRLLLLTRQQ